MVTSDSDTVPLDLPRCARVTGAPVQTPRAVRQFLEAHRIEAVLWVGDLIGPYAAQCHRAGVPAVWANPTLRGGGAWRRLAPFASGPPYEGVRAVIAPRGPEAQRLARTPGLQGRVETPGPLMRGGIVLPYDIEERDALAQILAARPVWLAACAAPDEIGAVLTAHQHAARLSHRLLLILSPDRLDDITTLRARVEAAGLRAALRSDGEDPEEETQVLIADLPDELGLWYRLAPITFLGQTLIAVPGARGRSPFEPAALGSTVLHGPATSGYPGDYVRLHRAGAAHGVASGEELGVAVARLLSPDAAAEMAQRAWIAVTEGAEATNRIVELLSQMLSEGAAARTGRQDKGQEPRPGAAPGNVEAQPRNASRTGP